MKPHWMLRAIAADDLPQLRAWMATPEAPPWSAAELAQATEERAASAGRERRGWALLDARGLLAGFLIATALHLADAPAECELEYVFVAPSMRRSGAGGALLERLLAWAVAISASEIWLEVRASNEAARRLYRAFGFAEAGVRKAYYPNPPEDAVLMRRRIDPPV
jgi:[ribosomal protein S18]-alanine N-acetyltransferase